MNKIKQFLALLKFQVFITPLPFLVFMPFVLVMPYYIPYFLSRSVHEYHPGLDQLITNPNIFMVGIIGLMILIPEISRGEMYLSQWPTGTEFLLTRAVDRYLVFRARSAVFYFVLLITPLAGLCAPHDSSLQIEEYGKISHQQLLDRIPGSIAAPADKFGRLGDITIPNGITLVDSWHVWQILSLAIVIQLFAVLIYKQKYRRYILWISYIVLIYVSIFVLTAHTPKDGSLSDDETMFLSFAAHQTLFWIVTIAALLFGQLWSERRFAGFEQ
ncbi:MAG: hypothetical protein ABSE62_13420 [Chthoniobacteraceae bacterium]|jgi:hypothetical protein